MKNTKIERILKEWENGNFELEISHEMAKWCRYYKESKEKGFDEIVIGAHECIHEGEVEELLKAAKELKIEYFVYASTFSSAFVIVNEMVKNGARVGKFVVKTYIQRRYGEDEVIEFPGMRINL